MSDTSNQPVAPVVTPVVTRPATGGSNLPIYVGILILLMFGGIMGSILFVPKAPGVTDAVTQQIITAMVALVSGYIGWQYGSSSNSQRKDDTINSLSK